MQNDKWLYGKPIIITECITKDVQRRKHRKKRINKKWLKRYGFKSVPDNDKVVIFEDILIMTQKCYERLEEKFAKWGGVDNG